MRAALPVLIAACATTHTPSPQGGPRGLHADEHVAMARQHDEMSRQAYRAPDRYAAQDPVSIVWVRSWDSAAEHERLAAVHRSNASAMQAAYDEACGVRPASEVSLSPLVRYGIGAWNTSTGVVVYLSPDAGPADRLIADMKCHRAWMMLSSSTGMDDCPLDLPGMQLDARGDGEAITLSIVIRDPALVEELHRRTAHDLELGMRLRKPAQ